MIEFPCEIKAGVTLSLSFSETAYPADDGWSLSIALRGPAAIDLAPTADGSAFALEVSAEDTGEYAAGVYWWEAKFSKDGEVVDGGNGTTNVLANLADVDGTYDGRTEAEIAVANIKAVLGKKATQDQLSFKIKDRELVHYSVGELLKLLNFWKLEVSKEKKKANGWSPIRQIKVRF